jgi:hypothetical protein
MTKPTSTTILVRHEDTAPRERSTCGWRHLLISRQDAAEGVAAWAHGAIGRMRVLVVGVPDIADDDLYFPEPQLGE